MNKTSSLYILSLLIFSACSLGFADQSSSSLDDKPSVDSAVNSGVQVPAMPADTTSAESQTSYLYDLKKLIAKSRENIKEVNEKIKEQAILKRNQKREERAHEYYEKGVELTNEGKLDEAREYFEKAIRITEHPEMVGYIKESQRRLKKQENALLTQERERYHQIKEDENTRKEDVEAAYKQAVELYKQKKYHPAKDAFEHVDELVPDYRATSSYLKIIDQDIITADALAVKQQGVEIARQQKEAEAARAKEKEMWRQQIDEKEKEHRAAIDQQAQEVYDEAVKLYKNKKFAEAKKKFEEVSWVIPDYKATMKYLARIDRDAQQEQDHVAEEQQKALQEQRWEQVVEQKKQETKQKNELEAKERQHEKDLQEQAQFLYSAAITLYDRKNMDEALEKFNDIEKLSPDFKSTRAYISRIEQTVSEERAQGNTALIDKIYTRAVQLFRDQQWDGSFAQFESVEQMSPDYKDTRRYLQKIEDVNGKNAQAKPAAAPEAVVPQGIPQVQIKANVSLEDQQKQVQEIAALAEKSEQLYRQVAEMSNDRSTAQMKRKMAKVNEILNSLKKAKERLLRHMQEEQWKEKQEESKSKQEERRAEADKMYHDGVEYLRSHDYASAKIKFLELENIIPDYKATRRYLNRIENEQEQAGVEAVTGNEKLESAHLGLLQNKENTAEFLRNQQDQEKQQKQEQQQQASLKDFAQKASDINDDIIRLSQNQDYEGMKAKFTELENTVTALTTLKDEMANEKDRHARDQQLALESADQRAKMHSAQEREDREIHAYYRAEPLKEYRPVLSNQPSDADHYKHREIMQEQNMLFNEGVDRYEHKKYTQAKLLFGELADQNDRRAESWLKKVDRAITRELLRSQEGEERERTAFIADQLKAQRQLIIIQERERRRQKKLTEELERQKRLYEDDRLLQLRKEETLKVQERERQRQEEKRLKLEKESEKQQESLRFHKIVPAVPKAVVAPVPPVAGTAMTPQQIKAQVDFSNKRKAFLDKKYMEDQKEQVRQKRIEEKQLEKKHREEFLRQQKLEREEKIKQEAIMREEAKNRRDIQRQERQRQAQLEAQREAVRRELENGVEAMYQEALGLYKKGDFMAAADKFKDVQDILPGYKKSGQLMDDARQKSMNVPPHEGTASDSSEEITDVPASHPAVVVSQPTHEDDVSKALDIFDPNAK